MVRFGKLMVLMAVWLLASSDITPVTYGEWTPYFMTRAELERSVFADGKARTIEDAGKIWVAGDVIYVVERYKGVHVIDNSKNWIEQTDFIVAPGCIDIAVKEGIIYLDNAVDLVAFDLTKKAVTARMENFFPEPLSPNGDQYAGDAGEMILVGWKQLVTTEGRQ